MPCQTPRGAHPAGRPTEDSRLKWSCIAQKTLAPATRVFSDGLPCFAGVTEAGCEHEPIVSGPGRQAAQNPTFRWVNTVLANIKNAMVGTYRHFDHKHAPRYFAEFQYRFNRRFDLSQMLARLGCVATRTPPMPYRLLKLAEIDA